MNTKVRRLRTIQALSGKPGWGWESDVTGNIPADENIDVLPPPPMAPPSFAYVYWPDRTQYWWVNESAWTKLMSHCVKMKVQAIQFVDHLTPSVPEPACLIPTRMRPLRRT